MKGYSLDWKNQRGNFKKILIKDLMLQKLRFCVPLTIIGMKSEHD
jgi:hypothetical protein